jgi:hypothetical protein
VRTHPAATHSLTHSLTNGNEARVEHGQFDGVGNRDQRGAALVDQLLLGLLQLLSALTRFGAVSVAAVRVARGGGRHRGRVAGHGRRRLCGGRTLTLTD